MFQRASFIFLLVASTGVCTACHIPPPTVREFAASPTLRLEALCKAQLATVQFIVHSPSLLQGVLECNEHRAVLVLTNEFHVRVRTITISDSGAIRDENSYLSPSARSAETVLSALRHALYADAPDAGDDPIQVVTRQLRP